MSNNSTEGDGEKEEDTEAAKYKEMLDEVFQKFDSETLLESLVALGEEQGAFHGCPYDVREELGLKPKNTNIVLGGGGREKYQQDELGLIPKNNNIVLGGGGREKYQQDDQFSSLPDGLPKLEVNSDSAFKELLSVSISAEIRFLMHMEDYFSKNEVLPHTKLDYAIDFLHRYYGNTDVSPGGLRDLVQILETKYKKRVARILFGGGIDALNDIDNVPKLAFLLGHRLWCPRAVSSEDDIAETDNDQSLR